MASQSALPIALLAILLIAFVARVLSYRRRRKPASLLDAPLFHWTPADPFSVRNLLDGGVCIMGRAGSGKTSSSGRQLAQSIVRNPNSGGLILAAKPEDLGEWRRIFEAAGRTQDLLVFGPHEPLRFNFLDYVRKNDGQTRSIVQCLLTIGESLQAHDPKGGADRDGFFRQQEERMLYNAVEIVQRATGSVSAPLLQKFIVGAAQSREDINDPKWRSESHCQMLQTAHDATKSDIETSDCQLAVDFWLAEFPTMADRTRSSILAGVLGLLHVYNTGVVSALVSQSSNVTPDETLVGRWVLVNMSPTEWGAAGSFVSAGWKFLTERAVLRRQAREADPFHVIWVDEAQQFTNSFDAQYIAQCRSHRGCLVFLSQSLPGYYAVLKGDSGEHQTRSLLANFSHTIFHAVDPTTAEWAAKKLGRRRETMFSGSNPAEADPFDEMFGQRKLTGSFSEHYENVLQETEFQNGLRTGGPANGFVCDAIVIRSGEPFACGENYLKLSFPQELT